MIIHRTDLTVIEHPSRRIDCGQTSFGVHDIQNLGQNAALRLRQRPPGQALCGRVHTGDHARSVGRNHRVADGKQRDGQILFAHANPLFSEAAFGDIVGEDEYRRAIIKHEGVRAHFDQNNAVVLAAMTP